MLNLQHGHYRPDQVARTGVVEPYDIRRVNPLYMARHTIDPFIYGIRPQGPSIGPRGNQALPPTSAQVAQAAQQVAHQLAQGQPAQVSVGGETHVATLNSMPPVGVMGLIVATAQHMVKTGRAAQVQAPGSAPVVAQPPPSAVAAARVLAKAPPGATLVPGKKPPSPPAPTSHFVITPHAAAPSAAMAPPRGPVPKMNPGKKPPPPPAPTSHFVITPHAPAARPGVVSKVTQARTPGRMLGEPQAPDLGPQSPFNVDLRRGIAVRGQGVSASWSQAGRSSMMTAAQRNAPSTGIAPVMTAGEWAQRNAGRQAYQQVQSLWKVR